MVSDIEMVSDTEMVRELQRIAAVTELHPTGL